jgi:hypothetical protein
MDWIGLCSNQRFSKDTDGLCSIITGNPTISYVTVYSPTSTSYGVIFFSILVGFLSFEHRKGGICERYVSEVILPEVGK